LHILREKPPLRSSYAPFWTRFLESELLPIG
jgi:hypothetical protein